MPKFLSFFVISCLHNVGTCGISLTTWRSCERASHAIVPRLAFFDRRGIKYSFLSTLCLRTWVSWSNDWKQCRRSGEKRNFIQVPCGKGCLKLRLYKICFAVCSLLFIVERYCGVSIFLSTAGPNNLITISTHPHSFSITQLLRERLIAATNMEHMSHPTQEKLREYSKTMVEQNVLPASNSVFAKLSNLSFSDLFQTSATSSSSEQDKQ